MTRRLAFWLVAAFVPAAIGIAFPAPEYYADLRKPPWAPPTWLFGPAWTVLYAFTGIAAWLVAKRGGPGTRVPLGLWRAACPQRRVDADLLRTAGTGPGARRDQRDVVAIAATTVAFFLRRTAAGALMLPYLAWVSFATLLNFEIWRLND
jgi:benzodiazapine receptor